MKNSFFSWIGGKKLMREIILERFPVEYNRYVEVFGGAGWILFAKKPEPFEVYNDFNSDLANMFHVVKHRHLAFLDELGFLPLNSKTEFDLMLDWHRKQDFSIPYREKELILAERHLSPLQLDDYRLLMSEKAELGDVKRAANFFKLLRYSYASGGSSFNGRPTTLHQTYKTIWQANRRLNENGVKSRSDLLLAQGEVGKGVIIQNKSFEDLIPLYDSPMTFFYCDPPYWGTEHHYEVGFPREMHYRLFELACSIEGYIMISYNDCPEIRELYKDFYIERFDRLNSISQRYEAGNMFGELIITNYDPYERQRKQPKQIALF